MRQLATIRKINEIRAHPNADAIELAMVGGWQVIVKKGEFQPGDLCVYFEIDSVLPIRPEFEFLRKGCYVKKDWLANSENTQGEGFRLKTIRLRGELSQGLVTPITEDLRISIGLSNMNFNVGDAQEPEVGMDVTELLGVVKWDPPLPAQLAGRAKGNFPSFIFKTDQERAQNLTDKIFGPWQDLDFEVSLKLDGSSMTVFYNKGQIGVCSRNLLLDHESEENKENSFIRTANDTGMLESLAAYCKEWGRNLALQGELMGPGVQGNRENFTSLRFFLFDIFDIDAQAYVSSKERLEIFNVLCIDSEFDHVPLFGILRPSSFANIEELLEHAEGASIVNPVAEGLVWKCLTDSRIHFKTISNMFLEGEE